jgi:hypothetical protein
VCRDESVSGLARRSPSTRNLVYPMRSCGVHAAAKEANDVAQALNREVQSLLKHQLLLEDDAKSHETVLSNLRARVDAASATLAEVQAKTARLMYTKPGAMCRTPYGVLRVRGFRTEDNMLLVVLPFCMPSARGYIHVDAIIALEVQSHSTLRPLSLRVASLDRSAEV